MRLIGSFPDGIGYGNVSIRTGSDQFIISGTATGNKKELTETDYSFVTRYNIEKNEVECTGLSKASAESLSHAAVYLGDPEIQSVIHIHNLVLWERYLDVLPTTPQTAEYGTPELAFAILKLFEKKEVSTSQVIIMGGHKEGIITFGKSVEGAGLNMLKLLE